MKNNQRNLLFLVLTLTTFFSSLGLYLKIDKNSREEDIFMALMIIGGVMSFGLMVLLAYDAISGNEEKYDEETRNDVINERIKHRTLAQQKLLTEEEIGRHVMHTHYAFENWRNIWRSFFFAFAHIFIFSSLIVFYVKYGQSNVESILILTVGVLSLTVHVGFLLYNLYAQYYLKEYREPIEMVRDKKYMS